MFDSQLNEAGFSAEDFRKANYSARDLSRNAREAEYEASDWYVGDLDWHECCAFFSASELKRAGFSLAELIQALFGPSELVEAGFAIPELEEEGVDVRDLSAKRRRVTP
jgi:intracellular multiplication protein IcmE